MIFLTFINYPAQLSLISTPHHDVSKQHCYRTGLKFPECCV